MSKYVRAGMAAVVLGLLVAGCGRPDLSAVPTTAEAPYGCDGVPLRAAELITGEKLETTVSTPGWGHPDKPFYCSLTGENTLVQVEEMPTKMSGFGPTDEQVLASMRASSGGDPLELDAPGSGYAWGDASAGWVCEGRSIVVAATGEHVEGRDRAEDVTRLLESMLPWVCGGQEVPEATESQ